MELRYHKRFKKQYRQLTPKLQKKADSAIRRFQKNPRDPRLRNHALHGELRGLRAISVMADMRIIFLEQDNDQRITFLHIGTHAQVYK